MYQIFIIKFPKKSSRFFLIFLGAFSIENKCHNHKSIVVEFVEFYFIRLTLMIVQWALIDSGLCARRDIARNSIKASFVETQQDNYEVLLEVSSNKFLVNMVTDTSGVIQWFEIVAVKWFMELSKRVIEVLKKVVSHLWEMVS